MSEHQALSEEQRDCLQEVVNIAIGQAADALARYLEVFVHLSIPRVYQPRAVELRSRSAELFGEGRFSFVRQHFNDSETESGISGQALVAFSDRSFPDIAELLQDNNPLDEAAQRQLLQSIAHILNDTCLDAINEQLQIRLEPDTPECSGQHFAVEQLLEEPVFQQDALLMVEVSYTLDGRDFLCIILLFFSGEAVVKVKQAMDALLID